MLIKPITYTDFFDETEHTDTFYFNLTKTEITEMRFSELMDELNELLDKFKAHDKNAPLSNDLVRELMRVTKIFVSKAYGVREGNRFVKKPELLDEFIESPAWDALFTEFFLGDDPEAVLKFLQGIFPKEIAEKMGKAELTEG